MKFRAGCYYRRGDWLIEVYYNCDGLLVAFNPRTCAEMPAADLPAGGWVPTDHAWTIHPVPTKDWPSGVIQIRALKGAKKSSGRSRKFFL